MKKANKNIITTTGLEITTAFIKNSLTTYARTKFNLNFHYNHGSRMRKYSWVLNPMSRRYENFQKNSYRSKIDSYNSIILFSKGVNILLIGRIWYWVYLGIHELSTFIFFKKLKSIPVKNKNAVVFSERHCWKLKMEGLSLRIMLLIQIQMYSLRVCNRNVSSYN